MARTQHGHRERNGGRHAASSRGSEAERERDEAMKEAGETVELMGHRAQQMSREASERVAESSHQFAVMGERAFETWMQSSNEALRRVLEVNVELANWGREQLDDSISAVRSLSQCRTVGDAYGVQIGLMRTSMEKSIRHANNVLNLATQAMIGGMQKAQRAGSETAEQMRSRSAE